MKNKATRLVLLCIMVVFGSFLFFVANPDVKPPDLFAGLLNAHPLIWVVIGFCLLVMFAGVSQTAMTHTNFLTHLMALTESLINSKNYEDARKVLEASFVINKVQFMDSFAVKSFLMTYLADIEIELEEFGQANRTIKELKDRCVQVRDNNMEGIAKRLEGKLLLREGDKEEALKALNESLELFEDNRFSKVDDERLKTNIILDELKN